MNYSYQGSEFPITRDDRPLDSCWIQGKKLPLYLKKKRKPWMYDWAGYNLKYLETMRLLDSVLLDSICQK